MCLALLAVLPAALRLLSHGGGAASTQRLARRALAPALSAANGENPDDDCTVAYGPSFTQDTVAMLADEAEVDELMETYGFMAERPSTPPQRGVFCTRALDMRSIKVIGYDMDYTLIDYKMELFEERVYHYSKESLRAKGFPVSGLKFTHELVVRGLVIDTQLGNVLKVDRFGFVRRAMHGETVLSPREIHESYGKEPPIDLREPRWVFLNTLFSVSEGCLYAQLVSRLDSGQLLRDSKPPFDAARCSTYEQLYRAVSKALFKAHVQGRMKAEIMNDPLRFINVEPGYTRTLLDQRACGKKLVLITNSDWVYTNTMMSASFEPFLPEGMSWADLFDVVVVSACKPEFFSDKRRPVYEIATADGYLREGFEFRERSKSHVNAYAGGYAALVERCFSFTGPQILYVGDHLFTDVNLAKRGLSWRTCLILQELEEEMTGLAEGIPAAQQLTRLMRKQDLLSAYANSLRTRLLHYGEVWDDGRAPEAATAALSSSVQDDVTRDGARHAAPAADVAEDAAQRHRLLGGIAALEERIRTNEEEIEARIAEEGNHVNEFWGYMSRAGFADKSHMMRQIEKYADIYTSRVSNLLPYTPYKQFLCQRQSLAHSSVTTTRPLMEHWRIMDESSEGAPPPFERLHQERVREAASRSEAERLRCEPLQND